MIRTRQSARLTAALLLLALLAGLCACGRTAETDGAVLRCGSLELTNRDLAYYYWSEYYFLINEGGSSLDPDTDPASQLADDSRTWQDTLLDRALLTVQDTSAMVLAAQEAGFTLPADYQDSLEQTLQNLTAYAEALGFTDESGAADTAAYLRASYGPEADEESFRRYLEHAYLATAYADALRAQLEAPDAEAVRTYFAQHAQDFPGLSLTDGPMPDALVLRFDRYDDNTAMANTVASSWLAEGGGADALRTLGETYCGGAEFWSAAWPGDGQTADCAADWLFDPARKTGDNAVFTDADSAYLVLVTGFEAEARWQQAAKEAMLDEQARNEALRISDRYELQIDRDAIVIPQPEGLFQKNNNEEQK